MKKVFLKLIALLFCLHVAAQNGNGPVTKIKLIYDSLDLKNIIPQIDQLNAGFEKKEPQKHYAIRQARAVFVELRNIDNLNTIHDLDKNMPLEAFIRKYPKAKVKKNILVTHELDKDFMGNTINRFSYIDPSQDNPFESFYLYDKNDLPANYKEDSAYNYYIEDYDVKTFPANYKGKVVYNFHGGYNNPEYNFIQAFYFLEDLTSPAIPDTYSRMLGYTETIFDSSVRVYNDDYPAGMNESMFLNKFPNDGIHAVDSFMNILRNMFDIKPIYNYYRYEAAIKKEFDSVKIMQIRNKFSETPSFHLLFENAVQDALANHHSNNIFEYLVGQLVSLEKELLIKQGRLPNRSCGNDNAPKIQDYSIADLALKTGNAKLFLNAHRYVINYMSDGDGFRNSYIEELIFIHVNALRYCIGSYISSMDNNKAIWNRYGKYNELYACKNRGEIESAIIHAVADKDLDNYNRLSLARLFAKYCFMEKDKSIKQRNIERLHTAIKDFPTCIAFNYSSYTKSIRKPYYN